MLNQLSLAGQTITGYLDWLNDRLTSYRLMLYFLLALVGWAIVGSFFNKVPYSWYEIVLSAAWLAAVCWAVNKSIARFLDIPANKESDLITALILSLMLNPPSGVHGYALNAAAAAAAIVSKFVLTHYKSHIFNPAAFGAFIAGTLFHNYASWWVGTQFMTPLVVIGGILVLRKMKRYTMALVFLGVYLLYLIYGSRSGGSLHFLWLEIIATPVIFLAVVMLIEPLTSPTDMPKYLPYAVIVGLFYSITSLKVTPEEALLIGNMFTFVVAANRRYELIFVRKNQEAQGIFSYAFAAPRGLKFKAGQYMEWTIAHNQTDSRGNRRYLTISSAPGESELAFTVKRPVQASAFKRKLDELKPGDKLLAGHLSGGFTLPRDAGQKLAFLAGGIGVTPFRSMIKHLLTSNQVRDVSLLYSANTPDELAFRDLFQKAQTVGLKTRYVTDGYLDSAKIKQLLPDYAERHFYVSGPYGFVRAAETALLKLGVGPSKIITDYFPGYGG